MTRGYVKSSPYFFRLIKGSMAALLLVLLVLAAWVPAPLQEPADLSRVPNPVKSAWFLLWIQELVSHSKYLVFPLLALVGVGVLLPWLKRGAAPVQAAWFARENRTVCVACLAVVGAVLVLTVIAMFFRGANWSFVLPF